MKQHFSKDEDFSMFRHLKSTLICFSFKAKLQPSINFNFFSLCESTPNYPWLFSKSSLWGKLIFSSSVWPLFIEKMWDSMVLSAGEADSFSRDSSSSCLSSSSESSKFLHSKTREFYQLNKYNFITNLSLFEDSWVF